MKSEIVRKAPRDGGTGGRGGDATLGACHTEIYLFYVILLGRTANRILKIFKLLLSTNLNCGVAPAGGGGVKGWRVRIVLEG